MEAWMDDADKDHQLLHSYLLIVCIACCYQFFNGHYTMLKSFAAIGESGRKQDVVVRLMLFVISVLMPSLNFSSSLSEGLDTYPTGTDEGDVYLYGCFGLIMSGYIWLMLGTSGLCFNLFGYFVVVPTILLNILYLRNDNPLSLPPLPVSDLSRQGNRGNQRKLKCLP